MLSPIILREKCQSLKYIRTASFKRKQGFWQADYSLQHKSIITLKYRVIFNTQLSWNFLVTLLKVNPGKKKKPKPSFLSFFLMFLLAAGLWQ